MQKDPKFFICTQLFSMLIDSKMHFRPTLPSPCLLAQRYLNFKYEAEVEDYLGDRVYIGSEYVTMACNVSFTKSQSIATADEDVHTSNPILEEKDNVFFDQATPSDAREYLGLNWKGLGKVKHQLKNNEGVESSSLCIQRG